MGWPPGNIRHVLVDAQLPLLRQAPYCWQHLALQPLPREKVLPDQERALLVAARQERSGTCWLM